jgi:hypothetical protein
MEYFGAQAVRVPCTTADTHSAPKRAFQNGTGFPQKMKIEMCWQQKEKKTLLTAWLNGPVVRQS